MGHLAKSTFANFVVYPMPLKRLIENLYFAAANQILAKKSSKIYWIASNNIFLLNYSQRFKLVQKLNRFLDSI